MRLEAKCKERLRKLSLCSNCRSLAALGMTNQARELHRDGRRAGDDVARTQIVSHRAADRAQIDAVMVPEPPVLDRNERVDEIRVDLAVRHPARVAPIVGSCRAKDN